MPAPAAARRPRQLLEEATGSDGPASALAAAPGTLRGVGVRSGGPAPLAEPAGAEAHAGTESSSMELGVVAVAAGGSLLALCLWRTLRKTVSAHGRGGPDGGGAVSSYIDAGGDAEEGGGEKFLAHATKGSPGEENNARVPS